MMHKCNDLSCILLRKYVCNISIKKYKFQFIYYTAWGVDITYFLDSSHEIDGKQVLNVLWNAVLLLIPYFSKSKIIFLISRNQFFFYIK